MDTQTVAGLLNWALGQDPLLLVLGYFLVRTQLANKSTLDVLNGIIAMLDTTRPDSKETPRKPA